MERNELQVFENETFGEIRMVLIDNEPWFVATDVCKILEHSNPTVAMASLEPYERSKFNLGRQGEANIISESGFYTLVLRSKKPIAKPFRLWVLKQEFLWKNGGNTMKRDLVDELYKTAYKRYREKYPNKDFASIPNFLDSLWFSIEGELNRNGYNAAKKYVEEAELIVLK